MKRTISAALVILALPGCNQAYPAPGKEDAAQSLSLGAELESRTEGDLNGDGLKDTVYIERSDEHRRLVVIISGRDASIRKVAGSVELGDTQIAPASLKIDKGVLVVEDFSRGTSAEDATYRYRYDAGAARMQLIGLDTHSYSTIHEHGARRVSWNLLTGDTITETEDLIKGGDAPVYADPVRVKSKRFSQVIYMEDTPDPYDLPKDGV